MAEGHPLLHANTERAVKALLCVDLVESVRLIEDDEEGVVRRWQELVTVVTRDILPAHEGRMVKSLGDGMLLEFPQVQSAVAAGFAIQRACEAANDGMQPESCMYLRIGAHVGPVIVGEHDIYGHEVNLAARLTTLAGPGEIVASAALRDHLTPLLDADVEDLGECYFKHVRDPVRAYRVGPTGNAPVIASGAWLQAELQPTVAVMPFAMRGDHAPSEVLGDVLADELIASLSRFSEMHVISRLSTSAFRDRRASLQDVRAHLGATFVVSGSFYVNGAALSITMEVADARSGVIVWSCRHNGTVAGLLAGDDDLMPRLSEEVVSSIINRELMRTQTQAMPTLESCTLLMGAIAYMHRPSMEEFDRAQLMLQTLTERVPRAPSPHAWLAKWHVLRLQQGWSGDRMLDAKLALDRTKRALDNDPRCSLALTIDGMVQTHFLKKLDVAMARYDEALNANPNDSLGWLLKGTLHAFRGEGSAAVAGTQRARRLSPLDPLRYYYDTLSATAALADKDYTGALELANRSFRVNRSHTSTLRVLTIAQWRLGMANEARTSLEELRKLEPKLTVSRWRERSPTEGFAIGEDWADALLNAGLPE